MVKDRQNIVLVATLTLVWVIVYGKVHIFIQVSP